MKRGNGLSEIELLKKLEEQIEEEEEESSGKQGRRKKEGNEGKGRESKWKKLYLSSCV